MTEVNTGIGEVLEALNDKADIDGSNFTAEAKETIVGWGAPDLDNVVKIGLTNNNDTYTAPMDGYVFLTAATNNYAVYHFDDQLIQIASYYYNSRHLYRVGKGTVIKKIDGTAVNGTNTYNAFVPCKGVNQ